MLSVLTSYYAAAALVASPTTAAAVSRTVTPSMAITSHYGGSGFSWHASRGLYMAPDEPEIDPRRKNEPAPARAPRPLAPLPMVGAGEDKVDVISRLLRDRILLLGSGVDDEVGNLLVAQLLYLANEDAGKDMTMYINSPGGSVSA